MKRVDPKVYTREYYLNDCTGFAEFKKSFGKILEPRFVELIKHFKIEPGTKVLDIGCGRGEMVFFAALGGAEAVGIDYSKDAIGLANLAKKKQSKTIQANTKFLLMDAKKLAFADSYFDLVILTDVVEHLYPKELDLTFKEIKRVLKNKGKVIIHTAPNKTFIDYFYKFYCYPVSTIIVLVWRLLTGKKYPNIAKTSDLRTDSHAIMHINEPTYFSLRKYFKKYNFTGKIISTNVTAIKPVLSFKDQLFNMVVFLHPLSKRFPFNVVSGSDFVSILINQK
jgi:ubiquinone/menaquinone biosynthesis C-methylase UbiE